MEHGKHRSRIYVRGVQAQLTKNSDVFFLFFFSTQLNLIYRWGPFAYSKDIQNFQGGGGGGGGESIFFQRDPNAYSYRNL